MGTIAEKLTYLEGTKSAIKDAIIAKGVEVTDSDTFRSYAEKIESIEAGGSCESQSKEINITDNGTRVVTPDEGYLLNQVTVTTNVTTGKPELPNGISFKNSTWTTFDTDPYDWSQIYSGNQLFAACKNLTSLTGSAIENVYFLDLVETFSSCSQLTSIPRLIGKPVSIEKLFTDCTKLEEPDLSGLDFSDLVKIDTTFRKCKSWCQDIDFTTAPIVSANYAFETSQVTTLPKINYSILEYGRYMFSASELSGDISIDLTNLVDASQMFANSEITSISLNGLKFNTTVSNMFNGCDQLQSITGFQCCSVNNTSVSGMLTGCTSLTDIDGLFNLGESFTSSPTIELQSCPLTRESCLNIFNTVYDFVANGSTVSPTLRFKSDVKALLSEEDIAIVTAKGWRVI